MNAEIKQIDEEDNFDIWFGFVERAWNKSVKFAESSLSATRPQGFTGRAPKVEKSDRVHALAVIVFKETMRSGRGV